MLAAQNSKVSATPSARPRRVSSLPGAESVFIQRACLHLPSWATERPTTRAVASTSVTTRACRRDHQKDSRQLDKPFFPAIGGKSQPLVKRQGARMIQGAGVDGQPLDRLQPGIA